MLESDTEIELRNIISAHHKSINDYKNKNNCIVKNLLIREILILTQT